MVELCPNCGPETSCYSCLRSYRNQRVHDLLSRGAAAAVLRSVLEPDAATDMRREMQLFADEVRPLLRRLIEAGAPVPIAGHELVDGSILEAAWPEHMVGVSLNDSALPVAGWRIAPPEQWSFEELLSLVN